MTIKLAAAILVFFSVLVLPASQAIGVEKQSSILGQSLFNSQAKWTSHENNTITLSSLKGKPTVLALFYSTCHSACPMILADLKAIESNLPASTKSSVQFAIFSFDSESDTPKTLKTYLKTQSLNPSRWTAFHGSSSSVRELAAMTGVRFKKLEDGSYDHSNIITILNSDGVIVHQQVGLRTNPKEAVDIITNLQLKK